MMGTLLYVHIVDIWVVQSASCLVHELTSPRDLQSTSWRIHELSSNPVYLQGFMVTWQSVDQYSEM